jgi:hypothetical protein
MPRNFVMTMHVASEHASAGRLANLAVRPLPIFVAVFLLIFVLSWPGVLSLDLWVLKDRGNFLYLDHLLDQGLRLGVDTYYSYGLLPVLFQHLLFGIFGRSHWPLLGFTVLYVVAMAGCWALIFARIPKPALAWPRRLSGETLWLLIFVGLSLTLFWVNPILPYAFVQLSMMFALLFALRGRLDIALAVSAVGCLSVPSMSLVLSAALCLFILAQWRTEGAHTVGRLVGLLAPGALTYGGLIVILIAVYGWRSLLATALPFQGMEFYEAAHFGLFTSGKEFWAPAGAGITYFLGTRAGWWIVANLMLFGLGAFAVALMARAHALRPAYVAVALCAVVEAVFVFHAYGSASEHTVFDPLLAAGALIGLAALPLGALRSPLIVLFAGLGILGQAGQIRDTALLWLHTRPSVASAGFYAKPEWSAEWSKILAASRNHKVLALSYGTGIHHFFPTIETADVWFLQRGQVFAADKARLMTKLRGADIAVEELTSPTGIIDDDPDIQRELAAMCMTSRTSFFVTWWRHPPADTRCLTPARRAAAR